MSCIYQDGLGGEYPFSCTEVPCGCGCGNLAPYTERDYNCEFGVVRGKKYYNLGKFCPVTECCNAPVCFNCAFETTIFCEYCREPSSVDFLAKEAYGKFSEKTNSWSITDFFRKLWKFHEFKEHLQGDCHLFFVWLKKHYERQWLWHSGCYSWDDLKLETRITQDLICEFRKFLLASRLVVPRYFFSKPHQIPMLNPHNQPFFTEVSIRRQHLLPSFLDACYSLQYSSFFTRKQLMKQTQVAIVGTLAMRLSQSKKEGEYQKQRHSAAERIFSRMMLNLLIKN
jgi:hypothetical protein